MFDSEKPDVYEKVYDGLVERLGACDLKASAQGLGLAWQDGGAMVPLLGRDYLVTGQGVSALDASKAAFTHRIVLAWFLLHAGRGEPAMRFIPYREFDGGQDFARSLAVTVEGRAAAFFSGRVDDLRQAALAIGGELAGERHEASADLALYFDAMPKLPLLLTFNDADDDFEAEAKVYYDLIATNFLDLECLAALGLILVLELQAADRRAKA